VGAYIFMEFVAWFMHKYVMHGLLWVLHKDHHLKNPESKLEKNDWFFVIFALPGMILTIIGAQNFSLWYFWAGLGITLYGFTYFSIHEVLVHKRLSWFKNPKHWYLRALKKAHTLHHRHLSAYPGENFGLLIVPFHYYKEAKQKL
jgi:beta-carotene 3-hydroxylase